MEPLVIVLVLLLFSVLDAVARKQRRAQDGGSPPARVATRPRSPDAPRRGQRVPAPEAASDAPAHAIHRGHPALRRPLAERRTPLDRPRDAEQSRPSPEVTAVRKMLAEGAPALRRAVILEEILSPPAAMRGDPYDP